MKLFYRIYFAEMNKSYFIRFRWLVMTIVISLGCLSLKYCSGFIKYFDIYILNLQYS